MIWKRNKSYVYTSLKITERDNLVKRHLLPAKLREGYEEAYNKYQK